MSFFINPDSTLRDVMDNVDRVVLHDYPQETAPKIDAQRSVLIPVHTPEPAPAPVGLLSLFRVGAAIRCFFNRQVMIADLC